MLRKIVFSVNGSRVVFAGNPLTRLIDVLRDELKLTGVKEGCGEGECGACSIIKDGKLVTSCIIPVGACEGSEICEGRDFSGWNIFQVIHPPERLAARKPCCFRMRSAR